MAIQRNFSNNKLSRDYKTQRSVADLTALGFNNSLENDEVSNGYRVLIRCKAGLSSIYV